MYCGVRQARPDFLAAETGRKGEPHYRGRATLDILMTIHKTARADRLVYQSLFPRGVICVIRAGVVEVTGAAGGGGRGPGSNLLPQEKHTPAEPDCETSQRNMSRIYLYCTGRAVYQERVLECSEGPLRTQLPRHRLPQWFRPILMSGQDTVCMCFDPRRHHVLLWIKEASKASRNLMLNHGHRFGGSPFLLVMLYPLADFQGTPFRLSDQLQLR